MHLLPKEFRGRIESWEELVATLDLLERSEEPVVVRAYAVERDESGPPERHGSVGSVQCTGFLRRAPGEHVDPAVELLIAVEPYRSREDGDFRADAEEGYFHLRRVAFNGADFWTFDGNDFFGVAVSVGDWVIEIGDTTRN
jgi:hypothetical protein